VRRVTTNEWLGVGGRLTHLEWLGVSLEASYALKDVSDSENNLHTHTQSTTQFVVIYCVAK